MSLFGGDSPDVFLLAEDEARMLGRSSVEPEHLLLAFSRRRRGRVSDLLGERGITARDVHAAIVGAVGMGDELVLGRLPRSRATEEVLQRAVVVAAERGDRRPEAVHVLLALADDGRV
jgi:ATP-dependent Clp protease ATP-binding subunit ClpA